MPKFTQVIKRTGAVVPFNKERITNAIYRAAVAVGGRDKEKAEELSAKVVEYLNKTYPDNYTPHIEEVQDAVEKVLIECGHAKVTKEFILYREERNRKRETEGKYASTPNENIPWAKIWHVLDWAVTKKLNTVELLNERIKNAEYPYIVHESECAYEDDIDTGANMISERADQLKMVFVSGPSSSGKTTTTIKLEKRLKKSGLTFKALNIDNYFFDLAMHPKDEFGDYDFETPQALDLEMINNHLVQLTQGKEVMIPFYDFKTGTRHLDHSKFKLEENEILLIDSLHGLYPAMSIDIPKEQKFKLYIEPLIQMKNNDGQYVRWTDIRLMRRMLRDSVYRAYNPQQTLEHWHYVRTSELRHIIPFISTTDFIVNSGMPYELPIYAHRLLKHFEKWVDMFKGNALKEDAFVRAERVYNLLKTIEPMPEDWAVPKDSVSREFIGGSIFEY